MNDAVQTRIRQACAFLTADDPRSAIPLLEEGRLLARSDVYALVDICVLRAIAEMGVGNSEAALAAVYEARQHDSEADARLRYYESRLVQAGSTTASGVSLALLPVRGRKTRPRTGMRVAMVWVLLLGTVGLAVLVWSAVKPGSSAPVADDARTEHTTPPSRADAAEDASPESERQKSPESSTASADAGTGAAPGNGADNADDAPTENAVVGATGATGAQADATEPGEFRTPRELPAAPNVDPPDMERIHEHVGLLVVAAHYEMSDGSRMTAPVAFGSCFAVDADGLVATSREVLATRKRVQETINLGGVTGQRPVWDLFVCFGPNTGNHLSARIIYESSLTDIALLKVQRTFKQPFTLAKVVRDGDPVFAIGYPNRPAESLAAMTPEKFLEQAGANMRPGQRDMSLVGIEKASFDATAALGVVTARTEEAGQQWIEHTAALSPGFEGGPLLTPDGKLVGMNVLESHGAERAGLALDMSTVWDELAPFLPPGG